MSDRLRGIAALLLVAALLTSGCGVGAAGSVRLPAPKPATVFPSWRGCAAEVSPLDLLESNDRSEQGRLPDDFVPVRAARCERGEGEQERMVEFRADEVDVLVAELARPSETWAPVSRSGACAGYGWLRPWLVLLDAEERWIMPQVPADACGHPLTREHDDPAATWYPYDAWPLDQSERRRLIELGCLPRVLVADILASPDVGNDHRAAIAPAEFERDATAVCRYRVGPTLHPSLAAEGHLESARRLTRAEQGSLRAAIVPAPAGRCAAAATTFATLVDVGDRIGVAVELDGCERLLETYTPMGAARAAAASESLLALLRA